MALNQKFGRNYSLYVVPPTGLPIQIGPDSPLTLEFNVTRNTYGTSNQGQIRVYNLSDTHRQQLRKDSWNQTDVNPMILGAGYGNNTPIIFNGNMRFAWSIRQGVDNITEMNGMDLGDIHVNKDFDGPVFPKGTPRQAIITALLSALATDNQGHPTGITIGAVGNFPGILSRDESYSGNLYDILNTLTGGGFAIDGGKAYALNMGEATPGIVPLIDSAHGLLSTPLRQDAYLIFDMVFEPSLKLFQQVQLKSTTGNNYQGFYKVIGLKHKGIISPVVSGDAITSVELLFSIAPFTTVAGA